MPPTPLLLFCILLSLVYSSSAGQRDMFVHSGSRRSWQRAGNHKEQICSCKVAPTEGMLACLLLYLRVRWEAPPASAHPPNDPFLQLLYLFHALKLPTDAFLELVLWLFINWAVMVEDVEGSSVVQNLSRAKHENKHICSHHHLKPFWQNYNDKTIIYLYTNMAFQISLKKHKYI